MKAMSEQVTLLIINKVLSIYGNIFRITLFFLVISGIYWFNLEGIPVQNFKFTYSDEFSFKKEFKTVHDLLA